MSKLVSIGLPFYNNQKTLANAIKSVLAQTYTDWELILINDGSNDNSLQIAQQYSRQDSRIKLISDGINRGLIYRLNQIIDESRGSYIARMDADDLMSDKRIQKQVELLESHPEISVSSTGIISADIELKPQGKRGCDKDTVDIISLFKNGSSIIHASLLARATWCKENKYLEGFERAEDRELFTRTIKSTNYKVIKEPLYYYMEIQNMTLEKYLKAYCTERKVLFKNWKGSLTLYQMFIMFVRSHLKSIIMRLIFLLGLEYRLLQSKNKPLTYLEKDEYLKVLSKIESL